MIKHNLIRTYQKRAIVLGLMLFLSVGIFAERWEPFHLLKRDLQRTSVPSAVLSFDQTGKILRKLGILHVIPNEFTDYPIRQQRTFNIHRDDSEDFLFQKKSRVGIQLYSIEQLKPEELPSSTIMHPDDLTPEAPILSIVIDKTALYDPEIGLMTHARARGRNWERPAFMSYFEQGTLVFATGIGLRIHGDRSRDHEKKSFRIYFDDIYGADQFKPGMLFDTQNEPMRELVVHNDVRHDGKYRWQFINPLAYDISRKIGALAPQTIPVKFFLNGILQGVYVLTEYLNENYLVSHFGHSQFNFIRTKRGTKMRPVQKSGNKHVYEEFSAWALADTPITMEEVAERVNLENLSFWMLSMLFCTPTDSRQGPMLLDETTPDAKWFWINWDMDHGFRNTYHKPKQDAWKFDKFQGLGPVDEREVLFTRLRKNSPAFRQYFTRLFVETMNHKLTDEFLHERVDYYQHIAETYGIKQLAGFEKFREFVTHRKPELRGHMQKYFYLGNSYICRVIGPEGIEFEIDGYPAQSGYVGWYFDGMSLSVRLSASLTRSFSHWLVNDQKVETDDPLRLQVHADIIIEAVFDDI